MQTDPSAYGGSIERLLRCVHSDYLSGERSCRESVPASVATAAWRREREGHSAQEGGFFSFHWHSGEWVAYGQPDGRVRGVYCPMHSAQRAARTDTDEHAAAIS